MHTYPPTLCPQFFTCSVNNCPLDPRYPNIFFSPDDAYTVCPMEKRVRVRIASQFQPGLLPMNGLKPREWSAKLAFERLSPSVKAHRIEQATQMVKRLNSEKATKNQKSDS